MNRKLMLKELEDSENRPFDVVIIGGGATGLGIALDAITRGYSTLLIEQNDFAKGTSGRSTKLVHGGVRYLAKGDILLVMEALTERGRILKNASHIAHNQEFLIPLYSWWDAILYTVGLTFYDLLAGTKSLGRSRFIGTKKTIDRLPLLVSENLKGAVVYHDGQFDDARFALDLAKSAAEKGAILLNYCKLISFIKGIDGKLKGLKVTNLDNHKDFTIQTSCIINATGVFADSIMQLDSPLAAPTIRPSQGVHIVLDKSFIESDSAIMIPKTSDGRVLFCIPWYDHVVVGTTDSPVDHLSLEPKALDEEINFILATAGLYLKKIPARKDILSVFAGLRPLAADISKTGSTKEISRRHKIYTSPSGLISVVGGKWTTYRRMADETLNKAIYLGLLPKRKCTTENMPVWELQSKLSSENFAIYGKSAHEIEDLIINDSSLAERIHPAFPFCKAELIWTIRNEMPLTLDDILSRRTRTLLLNASASIAMAPAVAAIMALELGYDLIWQKNQINDYLSIAENYLSSEIQVQKK